MTTACDKPAVQVRLVLDSSHNGGLVTTLYGSLFGSAALPMEATAVAVLSSPGSVTPNTDNLIPFAMNKCMFDQYWDSTRNEPKLATTPFLTVGPYQIPQTIGEPWLLRIGSAYHYDYCDSGQWTTFGNPSNSVPTVRDLLSNANPTALNIGDGTYIQPGTENTLFDNRNQPSVLSLYLGSDVTMAVVDNPSGLDSLSATIPIQGFAGFHITDVKGGSEKYIEGRFLKGIAGAGGSSGIGPAFGVYTPARLAM
jgi:hypothetical protein